MIVKKWIDLTHTIHPSIPTWEGNCGFHLHTELDYHECNSSVRFKVHSFTTRAGIGTHIDAPSHCFPEGILVDQIPPFIEPCVVINITHKSREFYQLSVRDLKTFESEHGAIPPRSCVFIYTGWDRFWSHPEKYRNNLQFPSVSKDAAHYLLEKDILALGIDTLSPDTPTNEFYVHALLLTHNIYIIENITNLRALPPIGGVAGCFPLKITSTEAPVRLLGGLL
jgi:kynurenine formamidase